MAYSVILSRSAERDRDSVIEYLLEQFKSPQAASHFMDELDSVLENLATMPDAYPTSDDPRLRRNAYRKALFMNYLALFQIDGDVVKVARIFHTSQDYARLV